MASWRLVIIGFVQVTLYQLISPRLKWWSYRQEPWEHFKFMKPNELNRLFNWILFVLVVLTHCGLVTPYGDRSGSTLALAMACCLMAPSHYLNQCWLIISEIQWFRAILQEMPQPTITKICLKIAYLKCHSNFPGTNELMTSQGGYSWWPMVYWETDNCLGQKWLKFINTYIYVYVCPLAGSYLISP